VNKRGETNVNRKTLFSDNQKYLSAKNRLEYTKTGKVAKKIARRKKKFPRRLTNTESSTQKQGGG